MTCISIPAIKLRHKEMDDYGKSSGMTVTYAAWHLNPEYRIFKTGTLLSRNEEYPSGLVIVSEKGIPTPYER